MSKRKAPKEDGVNGGIAGFLYELATYEKNVNRDMHRSGAYRKAAAAISDHADEIKSGDQAMKIKGVGKKIGEKIDEFLKTGKLRKLEKIRSDDTSVAINLLSRVAGIGPAKARDLYDKGITTIELLRENEDQLNNAQKIGLKHFEDFELRIPRDEIVRVERKVLNTLKEVDDTYVATICGSYRRGQASSGDIDVLLTHPKYDSTKSAKSQGHLLKDVVRAFTRCGLITDTISHGDTKFMGVCRLKEDLPFRRLDIRLLPCDQYYCGILYFTGSDVFNKNMRAHALEQGFTLNEYTLRPIDAGQQPLEPLPISSEEDIFDYISYDFKHPASRNN